MSNRNISEYLVRLHIPSIIFSAFIAVIAIFTFISSGDFPRGARLFPQTISVITLILAILSIASNLLHRTPLQLTKSEEPDTADLTSDTSFKEVWPYLAWISGAYLAMYVLGFFIASGLFCVLFLRNVACMSWAGNISMTTLCLTTLTVLGVGLNINWPEGLLAGFLG